MIFKRTIIRIVLVCIIITINLNLLSEEELWNEYNLTYETIKNENEFISQNPIWLPLRDQIMLPTKSGEGIKIIIKDKGKKEEKLILQYGYLSGYSTKTVFQPGAVLDLDLILNKIPYKYRIKIKFQENQWIYQRDCYTKLILPAGHLYFFDENSNGRYNDYGIDGIVFPGSSHIIKLKKEVYVVEDENVVKYLISDLVETGTKIKVIKIPLEGNPVYLKGLAYFNRMRTEAGLDHVGLNKNSCCACELHAKYLDMNGLGDGEAGLASHDEDSKKPGYTKEGEQAGHHSCIAWNKPDMINAIDEWMATFYHRIPFLHPGTRTIGMGLYKGIALLDAYSDCDFSINYEPIPYPSEGQKNVLLSFSCGEIPNPLPAGVSKAGYPITLTFKDKKITDVVASLIDTKNKPVDFYLSSPEKSANPIRPDNRETICLIPKQSLSISTIYTVEIKCKVNGKDFTKKWAFTTFADDKSPQDKERLITEPKQENELSPIIGEVVIPVLSSHFRLESSLHRKDTDIIINDAEVCFNLFKEIMGISDEANIWGSRCRLWIAENDEQYKKIIEFLYGKEDENREFIKAYLVSGCFRRRSAPYATLVCSRVYDKIMPKMNHMIAHQILEAWTGYFNFPLWIEEGVCLYLGVKVDNDASICIGEGTRPVDGKEDSRWYDTKKWPNLLIKEVENNKDTPLKILDKRTDLNSIKKSEKAKIYSVISFLIQGKEPIEKGLEDPSKRQWTNLGKLIYILRNKSIEESLAAVYNGLTIEKLDAEWKEWILKFTKPKEK